MIVGLRVSIVKVRRQAILNDSGNLAWPELLAVAGTYLPSREKQQFQLQDLLIWRGSSTHCRSNFKAWVYGRCYPLANVCAIYFAATFDIC